MSLAIRPLVCLVCLILSSQVLALDAVDENFIQYSSGKLLNKKEPKMSAEVNTLKILDTLSSLQGEQNFCSTPQKKINGRIKSFGTCSVDMNAGSEFNFTAGEYENLNDKNIPPFMKRYFDSQLSAERRNELKNKKISYIIRFPKSKELKAKDARYRHDKRKFKESSVLSSGESETTISLINDNKTNSPIGLVSMMIGDEGLGLLAMSDGNDKGATHSSKVEYKKNINASTNLLFEFESSLNTGKAGEKYDCTDGTNNVCQLQNFLAKTYLGAGFEKQKFNSKTATTKRIGVVGGALERNADKINRFFDSPKHQDLFHDILNEVSGEGTARKYENTERKNRYDLGGYAKLSASAARNLILMGGKCMVSLAGGGAALLETNGARRLDVWLSAGATYKGKRANHGAELALGYGVHNRAEQQSSESNGYVTGEDSALTFSYKYDRGHWFVKSGVTMFNGDKDMSREYVDGGDPDLQYRTSLTIAPGRKNTSVMGADLSAGINSQLVDSGKNQAFYLSYQDEKSGSKSELHFVELPIYSD